jgi:Zn-dependent protease/CBS domain-containing protein
MRESVRLGRIAGFPVALHWSVLVLVLLLAWGLAEGVLPRSAPGYSPVAYWLAGVIGALLLICSLLAHELAHAVVARRAGVEVVDLTLWVFGGVASLRGEAETPRAAFRIAAVGPATSILLAAGLGVLGWLVEASGQSVLLAAVVAWLAAINLVLGVFNLVPGAPLDGGRILAALLWQRSGDRHRAAATASTVGQAVAFALVALGLLTFVSGDSVGGLWLILIGWFLLTAARAEQAGGAAEHLLQAVTVAEVMSSPVRTGSTAASVADFVSRYVLSGPHSAYPVVDPHRGVVGLVTLDRLRSVPPAQRTSTPVGDVALPLAHVATAAPGDPVAPLLHRVTRESGGRALVFDGSRLVGIVTPADVTRALQARALLAETGGEPGR